MFFLELAGLLLGISLGLRPQEIPWGSPASPRKTLAFPLLLIRLTHSGNKTSRAVKLGTAKDLAVSARKGFMKKVHRRPGCQD